MGSNYFSHRHLYADEQLVDCYLKYRSQNKAAEELGVSRETVFYGVDLFDTSITLSRVIKKYNGICQICGKPVDLTAKEKGHIRRAYPTVDHVVPLSKGGGHTWENVQLAHMGCNAGKRDR